MSHTCEGCGAEYESIVYHRCYEPTSTKDFTSEQNAIATFNEQRYVVTAEQGNVELTGQGNLSLAEAKEVAQYISTVELASAVYVWPCKRDNPYEADSDGDPILMLMR